MVFVDVALLALVLGRLLGGRLGNLADAHIRGKALVFAAIGLQLVAFPVDLLPWSTPTPVAKAIWLLSYVLLVAMLLLNARIRGLALIAAGLVSNVIAILANGGLMPVRGAAMRAAGTDYDVHNNSIQLTEPHVGALVDRWAAPHWVPLANVYSVGDVLIALGLTVAIVAAMRGSAAARRPASIRPPAAPAQLDGAERSHA
jgi:hypothetical protein